MENTQRIMNPATQTLIEQLRHLDRNVRSQAALTLGRQPDADALPALLDALSTDPDFFVREDITWALLRLGEAAVDPLMDLLKSESADARHHAAHTLGKIGDPRAVDALIHVLGDSHPMVVMKAAFTLGQLKDTKAVPALVPLLGHEDREVQTSVTRAMESFAPTSIPYLIEALQSEHWQARVHAADILGWIEAEAAVPALIEVLDDAHWEVRFAAGTALNEIGGPDAVAALMRLQGDEHPNVSELASIVLSRM